MTRLASIVGVATVATLVLLSGCESATAKKDTDYAAALAGIWMTAELDGSVDKPTDPAIAPLVAHITDDKIAVKSQVTATIEDGDGSHAGTFTLTVSSVPTDEQLKASLEGAIGSSTVVTSASGTISVEDDSKILVTVTEIGNTPEAFAPPDNVDALVDMATPVGYELTDDQLTLSSVVFAGLGFAASPTDPITFEKQTEE